MGDDFTSFDEMQITTRHAAEAAARKLEEAKARNAAVQAQEERETSERKARSTRYTLEISERMRLAEYDRHGVDPLPGFRVSIGMLFRFGWKVVEISGEKRLVPPDPAAKPKRKTREDYYRDGGT
jgi:hypothetical protein